jgi:hypothetical protein
MTFKEAVEFLKLVKVPLSPSDRVKYKEAIKVVSSHTLRPLN